MELNPAVEELISEERALQNRLWLASHMSVERCSKILTYNGKERNSTLHLKVTLNTHNTIN